MKWKHDNVLNRIIICTTEKKLYVFNSQDELVRICPYRIVTIDDYIGTYIVRGDDYDKDLFHFECKSYQVFNPKRKKSEMLLLQAFKAFAYNETVKYDPFNGLKPYEIFCKEVKEELEKNMEILVDSENKVVVIKEMIDYQKIGFATKKMVVKCDERDIFDYRIGIGIALDRAGYFKDKKPFIEKSFKTKSAYYTFLYYEYFGTTLADIFDKQVKEEQADYKDRIIKEQVRKYECELRGEKYKPNKLTHKFIQVGII